MALRVLHIHYLIKPHNIPGRQGHFASDYGLLCWISTASQHYDKLGKDWGHVLTCSQENPHAAKYFPWRYRPNNCHHSSLWETHCPLMQLKNFLKMRIQDSILPLPIQRQVNYTWHEYSILFQSRLSVYRRKATSALCSQYWTCPVVMCLPHYTPSTGRQDFQTRIAGIQTVHLCSH